MCREEIVWKARKSESAERKGKKSFEAFFVCGGTAFEEGGNREFSKSALVNR